MKSNKYIILLPFAVLLSACVKEVSNQKVSEEELTVEAYSPYEDTKTVLGENGAVLWDGQESINVFCGTYSSKFTSSQTLNRSAKATFTGKISATSGTLYAVYPYSSNNKYDSSTGTFTINVPDSQTAIYGSFDKNAFIALASAGFDEPMHFKNVCGGFCFSLSSDKVKKVVFRGNNNESIAGLADISLIDGVPTAQKDDFPARRITIYPCDSETFEHGQKNYISMLPTDFTRGYTVELWTDDNTHYDYVENSHKALNRSAFGRVDDIDKGSIALVAEHISSADTRYTVKILDKDASVMDWTWSVSDENVVSILSSSKNQCVVREKEYGEVELSAKSPDGKYKVSKIIYSGIDLSFSETANSYIVSQSGGYKFKTVKGNSSSSVGEPYSAVVLWETFGTTIMPNTGDIIKKVSYSDGYVYFSTPSTLRNGNALIAVKDASGNILWSWHIWVTSESPGIIKQNNGYWLMDRNLGALSKGGFDASEEEKNLSAGLLYQWGRKDPFPGLAGCGSSEYNRQKQASTGSFAESQASSRLVNGNSLSYTVSHPTEFLTSSSTPYDWYCTGKTYQNNSLWSSEKTIYDPCPHGYRVPAKDVWGDSSQTNQMSETGYGTGVVLSVEGWYPFSGKFDRSHSLYGSSRSAYWSCSTYITSDVNGAYNGSYDLSCYSSGDIFCTTYGGYRSEGCSVRCQFEAKIVPLITTRK